MEYSNDFLQLIDGLIDQISELKIKIYEQKNEIMILKNEIYEKDSEISHLTIDRNSQAQINMMHSQNMGAEINILLNYEICFLDLSKRTEHCLLGENIRYIGDLVQKTTYALATIPNLAQKRMKEISERLSAYSLHLNMDIPNWQRPKENNDQ